MEDTLAYAYTYVIAEPEPSSCPDGVVPDSLPVILDLHGWNGNDYPADMGPAAWYCAVQVRPVDTSETWWFGFGAEADYRRGEVPSGGDWIVNYTEQRILRMIYDLFRDPELGPRVNPERVYVYGHSMGGQRGARPGPALPDRLRRRVRLGAHDRHGPLRRRRRHRLAPGRRVEWGSVADDLPVGIRAPAGWGGPYRTLRRHGRLQLAGPRREHAGAPRRRVRALRVAHGTRDDVVEWPTQAEPFYPALSASLRTFGSDPPG